MPILRRSRRHIPLISVLVILTGATSCTIPIKPQNHPVYLDPKAPLEQRVEDLISRMTLAEKISQLYNESPGIERLNVARYNWWNEALHGVARAGKATVYPQAIGLAATFNGPLLHKVATSISDEARAKHHYFNRHNVRFRYTGLTFWSPNVNIFRDPRWGRGQETYGEDPFLTGSLAIQFINGLQGDNPHYLKTAAMAKHFAVHSGPEKSRHSDDYHANPKDLWETYMPAFEMAVKDANVESIMCAYNRVNGEPACGSDMLLKQILREQWQFDGHVVSDCGAIADFYDPTAHDLVKSPAEAAAWALKSGTDLNCGTVRLSTFANLHFALQRNMIEEQDIDRALKRLLTTRFKLGMFDPIESVPFSNTPIEVVGSDKHLNLALTSSEESFVLLTNKDALPLTGSTKIAVIGPNAQNPASLVGNYHGEPIAPVTPLEGIIQKIGKENVVFSAGSTLVDDHHGYRPVIDAKYFSYQDDDGHWQQGLKASYFPATIEDGMASQPQMTRIDNNIDFYWKSSPIDDSIWDQFGVSWQGYLQVPEDGQYQFFGTRDIDLEIKIDNHSLAGQPVQLMAGQRYPFFAKAQFLRTWWGSNPFEPNIQLRWVNTSKNLAKEAIALAKKSDVIIFVAGISPEVEGEEMPVNYTGFDHGDRAKIDLPAPQKALLKSLKTLNKPIILVNISGSAMALNWEKENMDAIIQGFYPGEATGTALANILWGDSNPSGKLPITFYQGTEDLPGFKDYSMENRTYKFYQGTPLFPFGHGLSYSPFVFSEMRSPRKDNEYWSLNVTLANNGTLTGSEVSQLYMELLDAPQHTAKRELIAYRKDTLEPGQSKTITLQFNEKQLSYVTPKGKRIPYQGRVRLSVGGGQPGFKGSSNIIELDWTPAPK